MAAFYHPTVIAPALRLFYRARNGGTGMGVCAARRLRRYSTYLHSVRIAAGMTGILRLTLARLVPASELSSHFEYAAFFDFAACQEETSPVYDRERLSW